MGDTARLVHKKFCFDPIQFFSCDQFPVVGFVDQVSADAIRIRIAKRRSGLWAKLLGRAFCWFSAPAECSKNRSELRPPTVATFTLTGVLFGSLASTKRWHRMPRNGVDQPPLSRAGGRLTLA